MSWNVSQARRVKGGGGCLGVGGFSGKGRRAWRGVMMEWNSGVTSGLDHAGSSPSHLLVRVQVTVALGRQHHDEEASDWEGIDTEDLTKRVAVCFCRFIGQV